MFNIHIAPNNTQYPRAASFNFKHLTNRSPAHMTCSSMPKQCIRAINANPSMAAVHQYGIRLMFATDAAFLIKR